MFELNFSLDVGVRAGTLIHTDPHNRPPVHTPSQAGEMKPSAPLLWPTAAAFSSRLHKLAVLAPAPFPTSWALRRLALRALLAFLLLALLYEARQQQGKVTRWTVGAVKRMAWVVRWRLREWAAAYWRLRLPLRFRRKHAAFLYGASCVLTATSWGTDAFK